ncbi:GGDEF domain-containing protein [Cellvibrio zantedeschiae]|uniref:diguanylate cyclase n=1 Tax=Cellvibrio zantedeschiae TaxID=1237077 RepID=A0ABQ3B9M9_9GAMM|nr:GGDEF domain-containing protein [Cellvibrio zantedeschiae]GGY85932.1 GGDEF domain-containing protein [Cellvibrio zantedeschiae]
MPTKTFYSKLLLLAFLLTFAAIAAKHFLPQKKFALIPGDATKTSYYLSDHKDANGKDAIYWINYENSHFHCDHTKTVESFSCAINFVLAQTRTQGTSLQQFSTMKIDIKYKGPAKTLRIAMRNFDPRFSTTENYNSDKFIFINLRTSDLNVPISLSMNELKVADWWIAQFNLPREQAQLDFRNIISVAIDIEEQLQGTEHDIQINQLEFTGDWISTEHWYLAILLAWLSFGTVFAIVRLVQLQRKEQQQREKISDLVVTNSKLRTETDKFRKLSTVDALTSAFNRHGIEQIIESLDIRLNATSIILLDIDHFKRINDRRGHDAGDRVLQKLSDVILKSIRASDKLGRWGGEEFVLICPNTSVGMAMALAEKLRIIIFDTVFEAENPVAVTASFGIAAILPDEAFTSAFKRADEALYNAKSLGRNCVVVAEKDNPL